MRCNSYWRWTIQLGRKQGRGTCQEECREKGEKNLQSKGHLSPLAPLCIVFCSSLRFSLFKRAWVWGIADINAWRSFFVVRSDSPRAVVPPLGMISPSNCESWLQSGASTSSQQRKRESREWSLSILLFLNASRNPGLWGRIKCKLN